MLKTGNAGIESEIKDEQDIAYYEVGLGTDRRYPHTRGDIVPFTNVGTNTTVTFTNLDLEPGIGVYYFTVRAFSASYTSAIASSNGFYVTFSGGVTGLYEYFYENSVLLRPMAEVNQYECRN